TMRVCIWDRAGFAWSSPGANPHTAGQSADELQAALKELRESAPFILVGESYGGFVARVFQHRNPGLVAGMALIESAEEHQFDEIPEAAALLKSAASQLRIAVQISRTGVLRLKTLDDGRDLPEDVRPGMIAFQTHAATFEAALAEIEGI